MTMSQKARGSNFGKKEFPEVCAQLRVHEGGPRRGTSGRHQNPIFATSLRNQTRFQASFVSLPGCTGEATVGTEQEEVGLVSSSRRLRRRSHLKLCDAHD